MIVAGQIITGLVQRSIFKDPELTYVRRRKDGSCSIHVDELALVLDVMTGVQPTSWLKITSLEVMFSDEITGWINVEWVKKL